MKLFPYIKLGVMLKLEVLSQGIIPTKSWSSSNLYVVYLDSLGDDLELFFLLLIPEDIN